MALKPLGANNLRNIFSAESTRPEDHVGPKIDGGLKARRACHLLTCPVQLLMLMRARPRKSDENAAFGTILILAFTRRVRMVGF